MATTAKKNQNTTTTDPIADAEAALAAARSLLTQRQEEAKAAREEVEELRDRLGWGDDTVTPEAMVRAQFDVDRTAGLIKAAERAIKAAEKSLAQTLAEHEPTLADFVADAIQSNPWGWGLWGIPVSVGKPDQEAPTPSVWISQETPAEPVTVGYSKTPTGSVSGNVNLVVVTPDGKQIPDVSPIFTASRKLAQSAGGDVTPYSGEHTQGSTVRLAFRNVTAGLPILPMGTRQPTAAHGYLLRAVVDAGPKVYKQLGAVGRKQLVPAVTGEVVEVREVETVRDGRLITRTVDGVVKFRDVQRDLVEKVAKQVAGTDSPEAGRIERVDISSYDVRALENHLGVYAYEVTAAIRIVLRFRLAR
ncbi:MAG TPA: hypothetical protein VGD43_07495 [Micromonospora sp.]